MNTALALALAIAASRERGHVSSSDLLLAFLLLPKCNAFQLLDKMRVTGAARALHMPTECVRINLLCFCSAPEHPAHKRAERDAVLRREVSVSVCLSLILDYAEYELKQRQGSGGELTPALVLAAMAKLRSNAQILLGDAGLDYKLISAALSAN